MSELFYKSKFNGDLSQWNTCNVKDMSNMFDGSSFNGDISTWDVSNVNNMEWMFYNSQFNGDISQWKPYLLENCENMFLNCPENIPWWYSDDANEVIQKLKAYDVAQSLEQKLPVKVKGKKLKI